MNCLVRRGACSRIRKCLAAAEASSTTTTTDMMTNHMIITSRTTAAAAHSSSSAPCRRHFLSSVAATTSIVPSHDGYNDDNHYDVDESRMLKEEKTRHCKACTCRIDEDSEAADTTAHYPCGQDMQDDQELPPPLPEPVYSVHKRVLPSDLIALRSTRGRSMLLDALQHQSAESYWSLVEHFTNQSDPAYCGVTTLLIVLNSMSVDPNIRWRGGWRYFGNEDVLLQKCCIGHERIRRIGITFAEFARLAKCQGLHVTAKQPNVTTTIAANTTTTTVDDFRKDLQQVLCSSSSSDNSNDNNNNGIVVASFARSALGQTGEGHFSPIAAYHEESDHVLVLDVARFKYAPYWVSISKLFDAMKPLDDATKEPRGWFVLLPPSPSSLQRRRADEKNKGEARRPAHLVPEAKESDICPVGKVKVQYCEASKPRGTPFSR